MTTSMQSDALVLLTEILADPDSDREHGSFRGFQIELNLVDGNTAYSLPMTPRMAQGYAWAIAHGTEPGGEPLAVKVTSNSRDLSSTFVEIARDRLHDVTVTSAIRALGVPWRERTHLPPCSITLSTNALSGVNLDDFPENDNALMERLILG